MAKLNSILDLDIKNSEFCVIDFETTGLSAINNRAIEIGIVKIKNGKIKDKFSSLINPGCRIPYFITNLTGISDDDVEDAPTFDMLIPEIDKLLHNSVVVAHNAPFDMSFLKEEYKRSSEDPPENQSICTVRLAKKLVPEIKPKSLGNLTRSMKILHKSTHRALGDAHATAKLFLKFIDIYNEIYDSGTVKNLLDFQFPESKRIIDNKILKKISDEKREIPKNSGVYLFKDAKGKILYIGKAKSLRSRVTGYFTSSSNSKQKKITKRASTIEFLNTNSELSALILESELIKENKPTLNKLLKKYTNTYFIKITERPYSKVEIKTKFEMDGGDYYGPFSSRDSVIQLYELLNKNFMLRECNEKEFSKGKLCFLYEVKKCIGPCLKTYSPEDYEAELEHLSDFLKGNEQTVLDRMLKKMKMFSENKKYEEAAKMRDEINFLLNNLHRLVSIKEPINQANLLIEIKREIGSDFILMKDGKVAIFNFFNNENGKFFNLLEEHFETVFQMKEDFDIKDIERIKIIMSWLSKNKMLYNLYYLKNYSGIMDLAAKTGIRLPDNKFS
ncbi:MAG: exonuclease domain-containing protein [Melioribacteraceae bacterium]|nr:exonuclease domain-containing protein [Melioribacteraceae bacterium]